MTADPGPLEAQDTENEDEAEYTLESQARCPQCQTALTSVSIVRLLRTRVNFVSSLPRRGYVAVCPSCRGIIPAAIAG